MGAKLTVTAPWWVYVLFLTAAAAVIAGAYWAGRLDLRDKRVLAGIRANDARFERMRAVAERRRRLARTIDTLAEATVAAEPHWELDPRRVGDVRGPVIDADLEDAPVPDESREVEVDDDGYPPDLRMPHGAGRLPVEVRGDGRQALWRVNRGPGAHRYDRLEQPTQAIPRSQLDAVLADGVS